VGTVDDGEAVLEATRTLKPDVLILDISMGVMSGLEAARLLTRSGSKAKIVFLTVHNDQEFVEEAFSAGAVGYVIKATVGHRPACRRSGSADGTHLRLAGFDVSVPDTL
jgi:DNA-binding NarL/FixJ family response regulator